jgi:hypothetical protein
MNETDLCDPPQRTVFLDVAAEEFGRECPKKLDFYINFPSSIMILSSGSSDAIDWELFVEAPSSEANIKRLEGPRNTYLALAISVGDSCY